MKKTDEHKTAGGGYSEAQFRDFEDQIRKLRNEAARLKFDLAYLGEQLTIVRAKTFTHQGLGRRMHSIERCVLKIFAIYPPDRREFLSDDECTDIGIQFQGFAMNVYVLFDNMTWVCLLEAGHCGPWNHTRGHQPNAKRLSSQSGRLSVRYRTACWRFPTKQPLPPGNKFKNGFAMTKARRVSRTGRLHERPVVSS